MIMSSNKKAISVTLDADNLVWLRARAGVVGHRSVSELLDQIVADARTHGAGGTIRSVVGTIDIASADPSLEQADAVVRDLFDASLTRPMVVRETGPTYGSPKRMKRRG